MKLRKKYTAVIGMLICMFFFVGMAGKGSAAEVKIVSIDTGKVFESHPAFIEAMNAFQMQMGEAQKQIDGIENEEEKTSVQMHIQQQMRALAAQMQDSAFKKMKEDIQKFAKKKGYTYIVDSNALIAGGKDVTEELIKSFKTE